VRYRQALKVLRRMTREDVKIAFVAEGRVTSVASGRPYRAAGGGVASLPTRPLPPPSIPKVTETRAKIPPAVEGSKQPAATVFEEWFVGAERVFDGAGLRIDLKNGRSVYVVRPLDFTRLLEEVVILR
jgi:hypothetical protein